MEATAHSFYNLRGADSHAHERNRPPRLFDFTLTTDMHQIDPRHDSSGKLRFAFLLNLAFTVLEFAGGLWTNSIAIMTDALHDAGDSFSLGLALYLQRLSRRGPDAKFTYGYRRFSSLGALITGVVLIVGMVFIVWHAIGRLGQPAEVKVPGMLAIAVVGFVVNSVAAWRLHGGHSLTERMARWHLLEDSLGWAAVLVGAVVMLIWDLPIIDPILSLLISSFILWNVIGHVRRVGMVFLQATPHGFDQEQLKRRLAEIPCVLGSHHTQIWTLDGESHVLSTHLVMAADCSREQVLFAKQRVHELLRKQDFVNVTVEVEFAGEVCAAESLTHHDSKCS